MAHYSISHVTTFHYSYPVAVSHHSAFLKPISNADQNCINFKLAIAPGSTDVIERTDYFGNTTQLFSIQKLHDRLEVESTSLVEVNHQAVDLRSIQATCETVRSAILKSPLRDDGDTRQFLYPTELTPDIDAVKQFGQRFFTDKTPVGEALLAMLSAFKDEFEFDNNATDVNTPIAESLKSKRGVCQDFTHLMLAAIRACGLSARYCSGYILTHPPEGQPRLTGADASHAWVSVYVPNFGWVQVDPTNNASCDDQYVLVATGRDYSDVTMLKGAVTGGGEHSVTVGVTMHPIDADG